MIYLLHHKFLQSVYIPKNFRSRGTEYTLSLKSDIDKTEHTFEVTDRGQDDHLNYHFDLTLPPDVPTGEYTYQVLYRGRKVAEGLAVVKMEGREVEQYNKTIRYEQYKG